MVVWPKRPLLIACVALLAMSAAHVSAAVSWSDTLTDPAGDVVNITQKPAPGHTEADILTITSAVEGADLNVTMTLAGAYNSSGMYTVTILADGTKAYTFSYMMFIGFSASDPSGKAIDSLKGYHSADGKRLSWVVSRTDVMATASWRISGGNAMHNDLSNISSIETYLDLASASVGPGPGPGPEWDEGPSHMDIVYEFLSLTHLRMSVTDHLVGNNSLLIRTGLDEDHDGNVTAAEKDKAAKDQSHLTVTPVNMTLDGVNGTQTDTFDYLDAVGRADSRAPLRMVIVTDVTFPDPAASGSHVYRALTEDSSGSGDMFGNVTDNSSFKIRAPAGWRFVEGEWPTSLWPFFDIAKRTIEVQGKDFKTALSGRMPTNISMERASSGGGGKKEGFLPGAGPLAALAALAIPVALMARPRRRA